jgi:Rho termination factor, N-terminal domain
VPTNTQRDNDPQRPLLDAVRESQAAVIDVVRAWTDITERLTRDLRPPIARIDLADTVDRVFDLAEQALTAQRQLALTVAGVATRQVDTAVDAAVDTAVEAVESTRDAVEAAEPVAQAAEPVGKPEPSHKDEPPKPDRRTYEDRSIEELRERARELEIEGRSTMTKDELIAALRKQSR